MTLRFIRSPGSQPEALGRSRGGFGTKIVGVCDAAGRLVDFLLVAGQAHELAPSLTLLKRLPEAPDWALADIACDAQAFRDAARIARHAGCPESDSLGVRSLRIEMMTRRTRSDKEIVAEGVRKLR